MKRTSRLLVPSGPFRLPSARRPSALAAVAAVAATAGAMLIAAHGVVHLIGVTLLWKLGEPGQFRYADMVPAPGTGLAWAAGAVWLLAAVVFVVAGALALLRNPSWPIVALAGVCCSVPVLMLNPSRNAAGLAVDGMILIAALVWIIAERKRAAG